MNVHRSICLIFACFVAACSATLYRDEDVIGDPIDLTKRELCPSKKEAQLIVDSEPSKYKTHILSEARIDIRRPAPTCRYRVEYFDTRCSASKEVSIVLDQFEVAEPETWNCPAIEAVMQSLKSKTKGVCERFKITGPGVLQAFASCLYQVEVKGMLATG